MLYGANEVELGKQWANNKIIVNLEENYNPFGTLRRGEHITILIKVTNKETGNVKLRVITKDGKEIQDIKISN